MPTPKIEWRVTRWVSAKITAYSVTTRSFNKEDRLEDELIVFRVHSPHDIAVQEKRAADYCAYLNFLEERSEEVTITGAVAQRLLKENTK